MPTTVKGINNPGNIRKGGAAFLGEITSPDGFRGFKSLAYGYRAILKIFDTYYKRGLTTLEKAINTYAPPSDNNPTSAYVRFLASGLGIEPTTDLRAILYTPRAKELLRLLSRFEQGNRWKDDENELENALRLFNNKPLITYGGSAVVLLLVGGLVLYLTRT